ncbi:MAG: hypothetical protein COX62_08480 [Deltaproteobacteria bacterium CG_4_10_14_0_2_um_filter_43_8]|nr:MAG: hypothetical protein COV43_03315 [Deltaproteobacteria bacterium CG11_big_fil_rev_8_21_14_0_20_42_23]PJA18589.1 MAG: hypothetical protein COX62_08480 [Deltaproteobacteria bacterium CG_4_10_14_0_2_um_filter_43_8]PJC63805.1 MAG: hypothetical protein CO021_07930 [Deltaproteobacteria bacterium CG_4_9_14_0_2_um_filter_42_21]
MKTQKLFPGFLIAMPHLQDEMFAQSVILLLQHDEQGSMGLLLNKPLGQCVGNLVSEVQGATRKDDEVYLGGPVEPSKGFILHPDTYKDESTFFTDAGLSVSTSIRALKDLTLQRKVPFRFFIGHAAWAPLQLEQELANGSWMTVPIDEQMIFSTQSQAFWYQLLQKINLDPSRIVQGNAGELH